MKNFSQIGRFEPERPRRRRYQHGSLQKRKSEKHLSWVAYYWQEGRRRGKTLGKCAAMTRSEALNRMATLLRPLNADASHTRERLWTVRELIEESYLPLGRRKWKESTAGTTIARIKHHLIQDLGDWPLSAVTRDRLQTYLGQKATEGLGYGVRHHLRWDLRAIFRLAFQDGLIRLSPAENLFTPGESIPVRRILNPQEVRQILHVLKLREELIVRLAIFSGMRPGEILALQWKHVANNHVEVVQRIYRGKIDRPKTKRSRRLVALSPGTLVTLEQWRSTITTDDPEAWVFPSEKRTTPISRDCLWRRSIRPRLETIALEWATFQVMRRTQSSLSRKAGVDPKLVADQLGHGIGVNLDTYTVADLDQKLEALDSLESSIWAHSNPETPPS